MEKQNVQRRYKTNKSQQMYGETQMFAPTPVDRG